MEHIEPRPEITLKDAESTKQDADTVTKDAAGFQKSDRTAAKRKNLSSANKDEGFLLSSQGARVDAAIQKGLSPIGKPLGKGLETVTKPLGAVVGSTLGGVFTAGDAFGKAMGVGSGNLDKQKMDDEEQKNKDEAYEKIRQEGIGGRDQTAENPLGL